MTSATATVGGEIFTMTQSSISSSLYQAYKVTSMLDGNGNWTEWVPAMTGSYSGTNGLYAATTYATIVDGSIYYGEWIQIQTGSFHSISAYGIESQNNCCSLDYAGCRSPSDFIIAGSNDGLNWNMFDKQTGISGWTPVMTKMFYTSNLMTVKYIRLIILKIAGGAVKDPSLNKWLLYEGAVTACAAGTYSFAGASTCLTCPTNTYSQVGSSQCGSKPGYFSASLATRFPSAAMTAATTTIASENFTVTQSSYANQYVGYAAFAADDGVMGTPWLALAAYSGGAYVGTALTVVDGVTLNGEWLQLQSANAHALSAYAIQTQAGAACMRAPTNFVVAVSNDGVTWLNFDSRSGNTVWTDSQKKSFYNSGVVIAKYFRLIVTSMAGFDAYLVVNRWLLYEATMTQCPVGTYSAGLGVTACSACPSYSTSAIGAAACSATGGAYDLGSSLLAYYPFNSGNIMQDVSGKLGALTSTSWPTGQASGPRTGMSSALFTQANSQFFKLPAITLTDPFTVCQWCLNTAGVTHNWQRLFDFGNGPNSDNIFLALNINRQNPKAWIDQ